MDTGKLKDLIDLMNRHQLVELEVEEEGFRARLRKQEDRPREVLTFPGLMAAPAGVAAGDPRAAVAEPAVDEGKVIRSPLVGTFYTAPSPGSDVFVEVGDRIEPDQVLCIIEAMKVMNEIESEYDGEIVEVLVSNGQPVEFGEVLYRLRPA